MSKKHYDFAGWATKNDIRCSDGRTIRHGAFSADHGKRVPLVWNHRHDDVEEVLGYADLEERPEGTYAYCSFNNTTKGNAAKECVQHGDIVALSIFANHLKQKGGDVVHGVIREVSMVLAGANKGAMIDAVLEHGEISEESAEITFVGYGDIVLAHSEEDEKMRKQHDEDDVDEDEIEEVSEDEEDEETEEDLDEETEEDDDESPSKNVKHSDEEKDEETIADVLETLSEKQKKAVAVVVDRIINDFKKEKTMSHADDQNDEVSEDGETVADVLKTFTDKQKNVFYYIIGKLTKEKENDSEGGSEMKHNVFDGAEEQRTYLSHDDIHEILKVGKQMGSLRAAVQQAEDEGVIEHADGDYGVTNLDYLFPDYKSINPTPEFIKRDMGWVDGVLNGVHHTPFSRVKSIFADITEEEARARGYIKGKYKKEEVFTLLKRTTDPQTIYKKQKIDKDDLDDIEENFNILPWIKEEMQMMFREEAARAILIGDGRSSASDDKIQESHIRPIYNDDDLFTVKVPVNVAHDADGETIAKALIKAMVKARKQYKGTGSPKFYTTEDVLTDAILIENTLGERIYKSEAEVATAMRATGIVTVEPMENKTIAITADGSTTSYPLLGVLVNIGDYNVGSKNGGKTQFFEDFDLDYNQQKYLYEARMSGALTKPFSAISFYLVEAQS